MTAELIKLAVYAVLPAAPGWTLWLGLTSFVTVAGMLLLFYERSRRRTYVAILEVLQPGTLLLDRTYHCREVVVARQSQPGLIAYTNSVDLEDVGR
jgi:membrane protein implicated in regulation of membrane protease activity